MRYSFVLLGLLAGLQTAFAQTNPSLTLQAPLDVPPAKAVDLPASGGTLVAGAQGLTWLSAGGVPGPRLEGAFHSLDSRPLGNGTLVAAVDSTRQALVLATAAGPASPWQIGLALPPMAVALNGACLFRDPAGNLFVFLVGEGGHGEQWLIGSQERLLDNPRQVRTLALPPDASHCRVDDTSQQLAVNEAGLGWWLYPAQAEARAERSPVDLRQPFGGLAGSADGLAWAAGGLLGLDSKTGQLHLYQASGKGWQAMGSLSVPGGGHPETLAARPSPSGFDVVVQGDGHAGVRLGQLAWRPQPLAAASALPEVQAAAQTEPVARQGDAADDPALWIHPTDASRSLVLGTNKKQGLLVYGLDGRLRQSLDVGRLNNVDLRTGFRLAGKPVDLAVATQRDRNSLLIFAIRPDDGHLEVAGEVPTELGAIYGLCLYKDEQGIQAIANDKDGRFVQYRLQESQGKVVGQRLRGFALHSQPEGCVADDVQHRLFIGEEDVGVWALDARASEPAEPKPVIAVGDMLKADVEGLALYVKGDRRYLVVSSQGNDSYLVLDAQPPYRLHGAFRVGINAAAGIDGTSETDGLDVTSADLGGPWQAGLLVVQDGRKRMPEQAQNFKLVPWTDIARAVGLP
ncbi:phytase [Pseudomonas sp. DC3000-4b1]|uniref:phytase n=1 Tax=unclassified Pseudomonas TaxID=196821 RepID=UPI003CEF6240